MNKFTTTSTAALVLLLAACAEQEADIAASDETVAEEVADAETADAYASAEPGALPDAEVPLETEADPIAEALAERQDETVGMGAEDVIAEEEALSLARDEFALADADGDGALSREEYLAVTPIEAADPLSVGEGAEAANGEELAVGGELAGGDLSAAEYLAAKFQSVAGDDEAVSLAEMEEATREDFADADANGDDVLTGKETETFAALRGGRMSY